MGEPFWARVANDPLGIRKRRGVLSLASEIAPLGQEAGAKTFRCQTFMDRLV